MLNIGCHLSASKGYTHMAEETIKINGNTFQFFTRNPRGGQAKDIDENDAKNFLRIAKENNFAKILAHAPYTINICSDKPDIRRFGIDTMKDDLRRLEYTPGNMYNFHPGSHVGQGAQKGIDLISSSLNKLIHDEQKTTILLETMAGKGTEIGRTFDELQMIIENVEIDEKIGVCLDTCHVYDAGYDIKNDLDGVIDEFDSVIGLDRLKAIHLNDSKFGINSHKDRHEKIGNGELGLDAIVNIINHKSLRELPFFLETPNDIEGYKEEIKLLRGKYKE